jgi:hypothetical protein
MGYSTSFDGTFTIEPPLTAEHAIDYGAMVALLWDREVPQGMPAGHPDAYLQWQLSYGNAGLEWDGGEKFYAYTEWLAWLVEFWFRPRGYKVSGEVRYQGEEIGDTGVLRVVDGVVSKVAATFDDSPLDALREIVRRDKEGVLDVDDAVKLARAAIAKAEARR